MRFCPIWNKTDVRWKNANWTWSECRLVEEIISNHVGIDASLIGEELQGPAWLRDEKKKIRLIRLICKVKGEEFDESKEIKDIKISIKDIKLVVKTVANIELNIKE